MQDQAREHQRNFPTRNTRPIKERLTRILTIMANVPAMDDTPMEVHEPSAPPPKFYRDALE